MTARKTPSRRAICRPLAAALEIVLIGSDSIETVRLTHANYYDGMVTVSQYLAGI